MKIRSGVGDTPRSLVLNESRARPRGAESQKGNKLNAVEIQVRPGRRSSNEQHPHRDLPARRGEKTLAALKASPATAKAKARFILATDGADFEAEDQDSGETVACAYRDFPDHFGFFLPLAGITTVKQVRESSFDIRATSRLNRLYVELLKDNPEWGTAERRHDMNHFMARLAASGLRFGTRITTSVVFASMHIYHVAGGTPVAAILRPARTPKGSEVCTVIKHVTRRLRRHWPKTRLVWRGDSHYGRVEAMDWAEEHGADYIFGLAGNAALDALVAETAVNLRFYHAMSSKPKLRTYVSFLYQAGSWRRPRKVVARLECSLQPVAGSTGMRQELDIRYVVTSLKGSARHLYENVYCRRGQMVG